MQAVNGKAHNHLEVGMLVDQCRDILCDRAEVSLGFVKKHANKVAHLLARLLCRLNSIMYVGDTYAGYLVLMKSFFIQKKKNYTLERNYYIFS